MSNRLVVTGSTKGIGRAIVQELAAQFKQVDLIARGKEELVHFVNELKSQSAVIAKKYSADLSQREQIASLVSDLLKDQQSIDLLVLNAGTYIGGGITDISESNFESQLNLHFFANLELIRGLKDRLDKNCLIVIIGSVAGLAPRLNSGGYSVTKSALHALASNVREEMRSSGTKVTLIIPGPVKTQSWDGVDIPEKNFILPQDIALIVKGLTQLSAGAMVEEIIINSQIPF